MKSLLGFFILGNFLIGYSYAGIRNPRPSTPDQTWQNDQDLDDKVKRTAVLAASATAAALAVATTAVNALIPAGSKVIFFQASCPAGWTQDASVNGQIVRSTSGTGGGSAGTTDPSSTLTLAHAHTVNSHTHTISHQHEVPMGATSGSASTNWVPNTPNDWSAGGAHSVNVVDFSRGGTIGTQTITFMKTLNQDVTTSGAATPGTDSQLSDVTFKTMNVIVCTKN